MSRLRTFENPLTIRVARASMYPFEMAYQASPALSIDLRHEGRCSKWEGDTYVDCGIDSRQSIEM